MGFENWEKLLRICESLAGTYPGVNVVQEYYKMLAWLEADGRRKKKRLKVFAVNWLSKAHRQLLEVELRETVRHQLRRGEARNF